MKTSRTIWPLWAADWRPAVFLVLSCCLTLGFPRSLRADPPWYLGGTTVLTTTELKISPTVEAQVIGSPVILTAKISGVSIPGVTVSFYVDGNLIGTAPTDAFSKASLEFVSGSLDEGTHTFRAEFPETELATRHVGSHVLKFTDNVLVGYFDIYERDVAAASSAQLLQQFLKSVALSDSRWSDAGFQFSFDAKAGTTYPIEVSTDLVNWTVITNLTSGDGSELVVDKDAATTSCRFYRIGVAPLLQQTLHGAVIAAGVKSEGSATKLNQNVDERPR